MTLSRFSLIFSAAAALVASLFASNASATPPARVRRIAVLIGANSPPRGRTPLRFALDDANRMGAVLERVGRFAHGDVHVLLEPSPAEIERVLDAVAVQVGAAAAAAEDTLFVFYYSGHSDGQMLFPHGEMMPLAALRDRLAHINARVRVGILDTCRGGTWTQSKGVSVGPPLEPADLAALTSEGSALVSSSSGFENAHEADLVRGSFFTHHLAAGLLGAADRTGDGSITLQEAFDYAKERTIRDSARFAMVTQHPSFDVQLRGRQDVVLTQVASSPSALELQQTEGPLEVIHLSSGITIAELSAGQRQLRLALPPGRYMVRRVQNGRVHAKEIDVRAGSVVTLAEGQLEASGTERLAMKGDGEAASPPISTASTMPKGWFEARLALGMGIGPSRTWGEPSYDAYEGYRAENDKSVYLPLTEERYSSRGFDLIGTLTYGITDRLSWTIPVPAFAYRFGEAGKFEVIARAGLTGFNYARVLLATPDVGVAARAWTRYDQSIIVSLVARSRMGIKTEDHPGQAPTTWGGTAAAGYSWTIRNSVTLNAAVGITSDVRLGGREVYAGYEPLITPEPLLVIGSVQSLGYRALPLVQAHFSPRFSIDGYMSFGFDLTGNRQLRERYLVGLTWNF
ncbi:caspase family protein [Pendulispora rubella]|uniref:Caspase family protein n=1 Tax=Pendulispora rubella TaxID=2741070 RepID=A0ABZ2KRY1_9BACT